MRNGDFARASAPAPASRRSALLWWLTWIAWLPVFVPAVKDLVQAHPPPAQLAASLAGATLFFAVYLQTTWRCARDLASPAPRVPPAGAAAWAPVAVLTALSAALALLNGRERPGLFLDWAGLFIYTSACTAGWLPPRRAVGALAGLIVVIVAVGAAAHAGVAGVAQTVTFVLVVGAIVIALGRSVAMSQQLRAEREELARSAAATAERLRIARDLHDLLGHTLSLIALKSELARQLLGGAPERAAAELDDVERAARTALQQVREAVAGYRRPSLAGELTGARELLAAAGITYRDAGDDRAGRDLPPAIEAALAWTVREGVTNVIRHSHARSCTIRVTRDAREVCLEIADDDARATAAPNVPSGVTAPAGPPSAPARTIPAGPSSPPAGEAAGSGLRGLAERVATLGGRCEAGPRAGGGFRLGVCLPLEPGGRAEPGPSPASERAAGPAPAEGRR